jgi:dihydrodiol dehydrogenase / D-xylose 1-dehydrogenase (NADP)
LSVFQIVAVGARGIERAQDFATKNKIEKVYGSYEELAKDPEIGILHVAL